MNANIHLQIERLTTTIFLDDLDMCHIHTCDKIKRGGALPPLPFGTGINLVDSVTLITHYDRF